MKLMKCLIWVLRRKLMKYWKLYLSSVVFGCFLLLCYWKFVVFQKIIWIICLNFQQVFKILVMQILVINMWFCVLQNVMRYYVVFLIWSWIFLGLYFVVYVGRQQRWQNNLFVMVIKQMLYMVILIRYNVIGLCRVFVIGGCVFWLLWMLL